MFNINFADSKNSLAVTECLFKFYKEFVLNIKKNKVLSDKTHNKLF